MFMKLQPWAVPAVLRSPEGDGGGTGGSGEGGGGGTGDDGDKGGGGGDKNSKMVPLADHKALLDKFHETGNALKTVQAELKALKDAETSRKTKDSEDKGDFKNLYEQTKTEKAELQTKFETFKKDVVNTNRYHTLESALKGAGLKTGSENVIDFADFEKMPIETTSKGRIIVHGVEEMVDHLKKNYPFAFDAKKVSNVNAGGGAGGGRDDGGGTEITAADVLQAESEAKKDPKKMDAYHELYKRFAQQRAQQNQTRA